MHPGVSSLQASTASAQAGSLCLYRIGLSIQTHLKESVPDEERELCLHTIVTAKEPLIPIDRYSSFTRLKRITAWVLRFILNCGSRKLGQARSSGHLTVDAAEKYWVSHCCFADDIAALNRSITRSCVTCHRHSAKPHPLSFLVNSLLNVSPQTLCSAESHSIMPGLCRLNLDTFASQQFSKLMCAYSSH